MVALIYILSLNAYAENTIPRNVERLMLQSPKASLLIQGWRRSRNIEIVPSDISRTEITALRRVDESRPRGWHIVVHLNENRSLVDQAMDLSHELTHALSPKLNPYDPNLTVESYVSHGIEGPGGEAEAIITECEVGHDLLSHVKLAAQEQIKMRCSSVWKETSVMSEWKRSFYAVGEYVAYAKRWLKKIPISGEAPQFISAMAKKPYPLALIQEYFQINQALCQRTIERLTKAELPSSLDELFFKKRCSRE